MLATNTRNKITILFSIYRALEILLETRPKAQNIIVFIPKGPSENKSSKKPQKQLKTMTQKAGKNNPITTTLAKSKSGLAPKSLKLFKMVH